MQKIFDIYSQLGTLPNNLIFSIAAVFLCVGAVILFVLNSKRADKAEVEAREFSAYLPALDGLRAVSTILIFSFHMWQQSWISYRLQLTDKIWLFNLEPLQRYGYVVLDAFYVLSGFCLFYPVAREMFGECKRQDLKTFYIKRARKILPSYVLILLLILIFPVAGQIVNQDMPVQELLKHYLMHLLFIHNFSSDTVMSVVPTAWTMSIEVQFYVMFPLICIFFRRKPVLTTLGMIAVGVAVRMYLMVFSKMDQFAQANTFGYFDIFAFGMLAAYLVVKMRHSTVNWEKLRWLMTVLAVLSLVAAYHFMNFMGGAKLSDGSGADVYARFCYRFIPGIMFALFILSACYSKKFFEKGICGNKFFVFMSGISYNFYLVQHNVNILLKRMGIPYTSTNPVMNDRNAMEGFTLIATAICIIYAVLVTNYIEKPICKYGYKGCFSRLVPKSLKKSVVK